jgi:hypothetical protein
LRGDAPGAIIPGMERRKHRLDAMLLLALAALGAAGCEDSPNRSPYVSIVVPLQLHWNGQQQGVPYTGGPATFEAAAALRVVWDFRLEGFTDDGRRPVYAATFFNQDYLSFSWNLQSTGGNPDFAPGDSCVATVSFPQMDPADADKAQFTFVIQR